MWLPSHCSRETARGDLGTPTKRTLDLNTKLHAASFPVAGKLYQRQIEATDEEMDALVYELYGLTEEEIAIVEGRDH